MTRRRIGLGVLVLAVAGAALAWLAFRPRPDPNERKVTLQLDFKPGAEHAFLYAGKAQGVFKARGIDLEIVPGTGSPAAADMVDAGNVEFALCSGESALQAYANGRKVRNLASFYPTTPTVIVSLKDRNITRPEDLYGRTVGMVKNTSADKHYQAFVDKLKLDRSRIREVASGGSVQELIVPGTQLDALVHFEFLVPIQLKLKGYEINMIRLRDYEIDVLGQGLIGSPKVIDADPELTRKVTAGVVESLQRSFDKPDETLDLFLKECPEQDAAYSKEKLAWVNQFVRFGMLPGKPLGYQSAERWRKTEDYLIQSNLMKARVDLGAFYTNEFNAEVAK